MLAQSMVTFVPNLLATPVTLLRVARGSNILTITRCAMCTYAPDAGVRGTRLQHRYMFCATHRCEYLLHA